MQFLKHKGLTLVVLLLVALAASGCSVAGSGKIVQGKINVITTFYPIFFLAQEIGGDNANVINLLPAGVEPHDWTPKSQDIVNTSNSQLFFYNGAGLEGWVPNFLKGLNRNSKVKAVEVSQGIKRIVAGGEQEHPSLRKDDHHVDPHTWVSPKSAEQMALNIKNSYVEVDPAHKDQYEARFEALSAKLSELDRTFQEKLGSLPHKEIVVSHQAFGYLARDYGLKQYAIMGLSPDAEPRSRDLVKLSKLVKEKGIRYIFFEELVSDRLAKTLAAETGAKVLVLNPLEGLTQEEEKNGDNYFTVMEKNLQNLILALK